MGVGCGADCSFHRGVRLLRWGHSELMTSFQKRLWLARVFLVLGVVLVGLAHVLPTQADWLHAVDPPQRRGSELAKGMEVVWGTLKAAVRGSIRGRELVGAGVVLMVYLFVVAMPFFAGFLSRAKPLLWVVRVLAIGVAGWMQWQQVRFLGLRMGPGAYSLTGGLWLMVAGFFLIPKAGPSEGRQGWRRPVFLFAGVMLLLGVPSVFRSLFDRWMSAERRADCRGDAVVIGKILYLVDYTFRRSPKADEGWDRFITRPADLAAGESWVPVLTGPPEDPWGHPYHYVRREVVKPWGTEYPLPDIISDGPDGVPGTPDDVSEQPADGTRVVRKGDGVSIETRRTFE